MRNFRANLKRMLSVLLVLAMMIPIVNWGSVEANAASNIKIDGVDIGYAAGDYFTENGEACSSHSSTSNCMRYYPTGNSSTCDVDLKAWQCFAYARYCQWKLFGEYGDYDCGWGSFKDISGNLTKADCTATKIKSLYNGCAPATHIRTNLSSNGYYHSYVIVSTSDSGVTISDCNYTGKCKIRLDTLTWAEFASELMSFNGVKYSSSYKNYTATPVLSVQYHANGGTIENSGVVGYRYKVTTSAGLNMRSGAGTNYGVVASLAQNTTFEVKSADTKTVDGYTWGKTTVGSNTGWVVISDYVSKVATLRDTTYYLSSSLVYKTSSSAVLVHSMKYGETSENGLYNASTFGLTRTGYKFKGWSLSQSGGTVIDQNAALKPEEIVPELKNGSQSVTLYAIWEKGCPGAHSYKYSVTKSPTTSATGTLTGTCTACSGTTTVTLPKLTTTDYTYKVTKAATCTATGTGRYTWKTTTYGTFNFDVTIPATGHTYTNKVTAPTCTAQGYTTHTCSCGYSYKDTYTNATGHSYSYKATQAPSTSATGTLTGICSKCNGTTTVTLPKLTTTDYNYSVTKAATCTATGTDRYTWKTTTYGTFNFDVTIPATGHTYTNKVTAPTCTAQGYTTHTCSCGYSYKDSYTDALGHSYSNGSCTRCGAADPDHAVDENAPKIVVNGATATPGSTVTVDVVIENNPGIAYLSLTPSYDTSVMTLISVENGSIIKDLDQGFNQVYNYTWSADADTTANGTILRITFEIAEDAQTGNYPVTVICNEAYTLYGEDMSFTINGANVTVSDIVYGDANSDGTVNGKDVLLLRRYMANYNYSTATSTVTVFPGADANGDGTINGKDVLLLRRYMANFNYETNSSTVVLGPNN